MSVKVELSHTIKTIGFTSENELDLSKSVERVFYNPFKNLLEMVKSYLDIYKKDDVESLKEFVKLQDYSDKTIVLSNLDMYQCFVTTMYFSSFDPVEDDEWMDFSIEELEEILNDSFFDEYHRTKKLWGKHCRRAYPMLDVYCFAKLQSHAAAILPKDLLWDVNYIWTFEDFLYEIYGLQWYDIISTVYKAYGIHWFANNAENDPIKYKWACLAVSSCKKIGAIEDSVLKSDLNTIYKELLIAFTIRDTLEKNADVVDYVQECISNFDKDRIDNLVTHISNLEQERDQLINEKKQLNEGLALLEKQIRELQEDTGGDYDKVDEIAQRICCLLPQNTEMNAKVEKFKSIWGKLDDSTKKDIKTSISMFERCESFDLALFPMIRSLEHEFDRNFFSPFHCSKTYIKCKGAICKNKRYEKTHDALVEKKNSHPTMGNIPFIGKAMTDVKAQEASDVIKSFRIFLEDNRKAFVAICKTLYSYKLGTQKNRLVDLRNGIAHGDYNVTKEVDKKCYEEVAKLLYEPPLQILFELVEASMRK